MSAHVKEKSIDSNEVLKSDGGLSLFHFETAAKLPVGSSARDEQICMGEAYKMEAIRISIRMNGANHGQTRAMEEGLGMFD